MSTRPRTTPVHPSDRLGSLRPLCGFFHRPVCRMRWPKSDGHNHPHHKNVCSSGTEIFSNGISVNPVSGIIDAWHTICPLCGLSGTLQKPLKNSKRRNQDFASKYSQTIL